MASDTEGSIVHPLNSNTGQLVINRLPGVTFNCVRWVIPGFSFSEMTQGNPLQDLYLPGSKFDPDPFVAEFLVDEEMTNYLSVVAWMYRLRGLSAPELLDLLDDFTFNVLDNQGRPSVAFRYSGGFPTGVDALEGSSNSGTPSKVTSTITMRFQSMSIDVYRGPDQNLITPINDFYGA